MFLFFLALPQYFFGLWNLLALQLGEVRPLTPSFFYAGLVNNIIIGSFYFIFMSVVGFLPFFFVCLPPPTQTLFSEFWVRSGFRSSPFVLLSFFIPSPVFFASLSLNLVYGGGQVLFARELSLFEVTSVLCTFLVNDCKTTE